VRLLGDIVFVAAAQTHKALIAHEKALQWRELFDLALREHLDQDRLIAMSYRIAGRLSLFRDNLHS
jgi:elongator complex protein 1